MLLCIVIMIITSLTSLHSAHILAEWIHYLRGLDMGYTYLRVLLTASHALLISVVILTGSVWSWAAFL